MIRKFPNRTPYKQQPAKGSTSSSNDSLNQIPPDSPKDEKTVDNGLMVISKDKVVGNEQKKANKAGIRNNKNKKKGTSVSKLAPQDQKTNDNVQPPSPIQEETDQSIFQDNSNDQTNVLLMLPQNSIDQQDNKKIDQPPSPTEEKTDQNEFSERNNNQSANIPPEKTNHQHALESLNIPFPGSDQFFSSNEENTDQNEFSERNNNQSANFPSEKTNHQHALESFNIPFSSFNQFFSPTEEKTDQNEFPERNNNQSANFPIEKTNHQHALESFSIPFSSFNQFFSPTEEKTDQNEFPERNNNQSADFPSEKANHQQTPESFSIPLFGSDQFFSPTEEKTDQNEFPERNNNQFGYFPSEKANQQQTPESFNIPFSSFNQSPSPTEEKTDQTLNETEQQVKKSENSKTKSKTNHTNRPHHVPAPSKKPKTKANNQEAMISQKSSSTHDEMIHNTPQTSNDSINNQTPNGIQSRSQFVSRNYKTQNSNQELKQYSYQSFSGNDNKDDESKIIIDIVNIFNRLKTNLPLSPSSSLQSL